MLDPMPQIPKERILSTAFRQKKEKKEGKKGRLDKYLINGPPNMRSLAVGTCENPWLSYIDDHRNKDQRMSVMGS
jgi:hypothetical protein